MSAYQAQLSPSDSSSTKSRVPMSIRAECTPSNFHGSFGSLPGARITIGAPLVPRCVRASVKKNPWPWNRMPKDDAITAWRTTGRW